MSLRRRRFFQQLNYFSSHRSRLLLDVQLINETCRVSQHDGVGNAI